MWKLDFKDLLIREHVSRYGGGPNTEQSHRVNSYQILHLNSMSIYSKVKWFYGIHHYIFNIFHGSILTKSIFMKSIKMKVDEM